MKTKIFFLTTMLVATTVFAQQAAPTPPKKPFAGFGSSLDKRPDGTTSSSGGRGISLDQAAQGPAPLEPINGFELISAIYGVPGEKKRENVILQVFKLLKEGNVSATNRVQIPVTNDLMKRPEAESENTTGFVTGSGSDAQVHIYRAAKKMITITYRLNGVEKTVYGRQGEIMKLPQ